VFLHRFGAESWPKIPARPPALRRVPRSAKGSIYIDNVPAWVCGKCGEQYFDAPVYKRLEEIARHSDRIRKTVCFPLAEYDAAIG
jgi:hypothetical protein